MKTVHLILQGKGGVGKSLVASFLCQYLRKNNQIIAIDTDPVNATLTGYRELSPKRLEIRSGDNIDPRLFDNLMEIILKNEKEENLQIIVDNGASTFVPLCSWIKENNFFEMLQEYGIAVFLHTVITGGQAQNDTLDGLEALTNSFNVPIFLWLNPFFGGVAHKGKEFEEFKIYRDNIEKFHALIRIPQKNPQTFGKDLEELFSRKQTFESAIVDESLSVMTRQRLKIFWNEVQEEIAKAHLIEV